MLSALVPENTIQAYLLGTLRYNLRNAILGNGKQVQDFLLPRDDPCKPFDLVEHSLN
jgi:hypothetical protein